MNLNLDVKPLHPEQRAIKTIPMLLQPQQLQPPQQQQPPPQPQQQQQQQQQPPPPQQQPQQQQSSILQTKSRYTEDRRFIQFFGKYYIEYRYNH